MIQVASSGTPLELAGRRRRGISVTSSSAAFTPLSLSPFVWFDFSTTAGGAAAIASISDLSGNAHTASQGTAGKRPTSQSAIQNGLNIGRFDGVDDELLTASFSQAQPFVVYAVVANNVGIAGRYFSDGASAVRVGSSSAVPGHDDFAGSSLSPVYASGTYQSWRQITTVVNGASSIARSNGAQDGTGAIGAATVAAGIALGSAGAAQFWGGDMGEAFAVAGSSVSTAAEAYLKTKWGTP